MAWAKVWSHLWHVSELIATKVCSQIGGTLNVMFENQVETCTDWTSLNFQFKDHDFLSNLLLKKIIYCVTDQTSVTWFQRSALNLKFSVFTFLRSMSCLMCIEQTLCKEKKLSNPIYVLFDNMYHQKVWGQEFWYTLSGLYIQLEKSKNEDPASKKSVQGCETLYTVF